MNLYERPNVTPNPAPKPTRHWGLDWGLVRVRLYELATS